MRLTITADEPLRKLWKINTDFPVERSAPSSWRTSHRKVIGAS